MGVRAELRSDEFRDVPKRDRRQRERRMSAGGHAWTVLARRGMLAQCASRALLLVVQVHLEKIVQLRPQAERTGADKATADALRPLFSLFRKGRCLYHDFPNVFNHPNVTLVDTNGRRVERIDETGVIANDGHRDLDCLIFAIGPT